MQKVAVALVLLCGAAEAIRSGRSSEQLESQASAWLRAHPAAQQDDLAELKTENPSAYALVKALLMKKSLGLLDPRHPTASFAAPAPKPEGEEESGVAAYAKLASPGELQHASASAEVQALDEEVPVSHPAHKDWLNWKPTNSAAEDDSMVSSVLGNAASLSDSSAPTKSVQSQTKEPTTSAFAADEAALADEQPAAVQPAPAQPAAVQPAAVDHQEPAPQGDHDNSDSKGIDLDAKAAAAPSAPQPAGTNPYLKDMDLNSGESAPKPAASLSSVDQAVSHKSEPQADGKSDALLSWLGTGKAKPSMVQQAHAASAHNPYLSDLQ